VDNITVAVLQTEDPARGVLRRGQQAAQQAAQQRRQSSRMALAAWRRPAAWRPAAPLGHRLAGYFAFTRRNANATATQLARMTAQPWLRRRPQGLGRLRPRGRCPPPCPPGPGEIAKLFAGPHLLAILLDDNRLLQVPASEPWFIAVNHAASEPTPTSTWRATRSSNCRA